MANQFLILILGSAHTHTHTRTHTHTHTIMSFTQYNSDNTLKKKRQRMVPADCHTTKYTPGLLEMVMVQPYRNYWPHCKAIISPVAVCT